MKMKTKTKTNPKFRLLAAVTALAIALSIGIIYNIPTYTIHANPEETTIAPPVPDLEWYTNATPNETAYVIQTLEDLLGLAIIVNTGDGGCSVSHGEDYCDACVANDNTPCDFKDEDFSKSTIRLAGDIDLSAHPDWTPIGTEDTPFAGSLFNGNGHAIIGLTSTQGGLFGYTNKKAAIKNVTLVDAKISGAGNVGGIVNNAADETNISDCYVLESAPRISTITGGANKFVGGIAGEIRGDTIIERCYTEGKVSGTVAGGLVGHAKSVTAPPSRNGMTINSIVNSYSTADVAGYAQAGGILGKNSGGNTVKYTYFAGKLTAGSDLIGASETPAAGGIVAYVNHADHPTEPPAIVNNVALNESIDAGYVPTDQIGRVGGIAEPDRTGPETLDSKVPALNDDSQTFADANEDVVMVDYTIQNPDGKGNAMFGVNYTKWYNNNYALDMEVVYSAPATGGGYTIVTWPFVKNNFLIPMGYNLHGAEMPHYDIAAKTWADNAAHVMEGPLKNNKHGGELPVPELPHVSGPGYDPYHGELRYNEPEFWLMGEYNIWQRCFNVRGKVDDQDNPVVCAP
ncbi:MAG: hypothetical protein FWH07_07250, partial [Oscillospiraceae bacterium]|nr:hypothetical protein [Oscillospiraceae bacterium]